MVPPGICGSAEPTSLSKRAQRNAVIDSGVDLCRPPTGVRERHGLATTLFLPSQRMCESYAPMNYRRSGAEGL